MSITRLLRPIMIRRYNSETWWKHPTEHLQRAELKAMLRGGASTLWAKEHGLRPGMTYEQFRESSPAVDYEDIRSYVGRMIAGESNILWPGRTRRFAQSSGTAGGKSKFIPITDDSLDRCHYRGATYAASHYLRLHPDSRIFDGRSFILGGSFANTLGIENSRVKVGDLSATLIDRINPLVNLVRIPDKRTALLSDWEVKLPALVEAGLRADVTNIAGVPSWFLTVLKQMLARSGKSEIHEIWPHFEVFFHGGIAFGPYRDEYDSIADPARTRYFENYNASEGFFGVQASREPGPMVLIPDCGVFYELLAPGADPTEAIPLWEARPGATYELLITSCNGLWRYRIGDTVKIVSTEPVTFVIAGRTKAFINAFGEELMVHNADRALAAVCAATGARIADYTAAPVYARGGNHGHHQWIIEFSTPPSDLDAFASQLDKALREENSDYDAKRYKGIFLDRLEIVAARPGLFDAWLASTGKRGGQRKVPRLSNDRALADTLLAMNNQQL